MNRMLVRQLVCFTLITAVMGAAEGPHQGATPSPATSGVTQLAQVDVCKLLTNTEIEGLQKAHVEEAKASTQSGGGLLFRQCLFRTSTPAMSVSVALAIPSAQQPRDYWRKQFHARPDKEEHEAKKKSTKSAHAKDEEDASKPIDIKGLGEEAYWIGGPISGALYVLHANTFLRISVGGVREEPVRIQKSITLARAALKRL